ncbi:uncharacterized protein LOC132294262 isoform X8 [Cornus florida]|uniref:uncharacterized protein LOC132294262 isoform X8 n=1 Tax=Cornus florida TaxID=4283 RepID=UPI0028A0CBE9|nr:uncharacterized protein LOC132294262 isoform X8 [Cornus florida]
MGFDIQLFHADFDGFLVIPRSRGHTKGYLADNEYEGTDSLPLEESLAGYKKKTTSAGPVLEGSGSSGSSVPSTIMNESPSENERKMHEKTEH